VFDYGNHSPHRQGFFAETQACGMMLTFVDQWSGVMLIRNNVVLVTGGASGLGGATAEIIVENGGKVVIADVQESLGQALVQKLGAANATFVKCDVTSEADGQAAVDAAVRMGTLVGLVNCAGIGPAAKTVGKDGPHPLAMFSKVIQVNLIGSFNMIRLAATAMCKNTPNEEGEKGVIVNTASVAAYDGQIGQAAYAASKGGIVGMTLPIARDLARDGVRVVTIAPGLFLTPLLAGMPQEVQDSLGKQVPFPSRLGRPNEYAIMVKHVFTNVMLNGETIRLDGAIRMAPR
jgi:NAD(P)-dependent dehydrogenase (short-subunit alcohol dehydrogenase family)